MTISKETLISEVADGYDSYIPSGDVLDQLGKIDLTVVTAPSGMGKNTLINATHLPRVLPETIREPRSNNGFMEQDGVEYEFRGQDLASVYGDYQLGNYVQIGMGPSRSSFYATRAQNYPQEGPALIDLMASQVDTMRELPFASVQAVHISAPSYEEWMNRLNARGTFTKEEWAGRRTEAMQSIELALEDDACLFLLNSDIPVAARALYDVATRRRNTTVTDKKPRALAAKLLKLLQDG